MSKLKKIWATREARPYEIVAINVGLNESHERIKKIQKQYQMPFTVVLDTQPVANVSVGISSSDTGEGTVSPSSLTFTSANWNTPQTVTVTGVNDDVDDGNISYNLITAAATSTDGKYNGINPVDRSTNNIDDDIKILKILERIENSHEGFKKS